MAKTSAKKSASKVERVPKKPYEDELFRLQAELVKVQEWVKAEGKRLVVHLRGPRRRRQGRRDQARHAVPQPARRPHRRAAGADRARARRSGTSSATSRTCRRRARSCCSTAPGTTAAGVERVMGFCTADEYHRFLHQCPIFERMLVEDGIMLRKYWFSVSDAEQEARFQSRLEDPMRRWKLSPMDLESITRWEDYSRAKDEMMVHTDIPEAPWYVVESDDKRRARINMIAHLLEHPDVHRASTAADLKLPKRPKSTGYERPPRDMPSLRARSRRVAGAQLGLRRRMDPDVVVPGISNWELLGRLALTLLLSGLIGFERELRDQAAGLRTHILVGVGAGAVHADLGLRVRRLPDRAGRDRRGDRPGADRRPGRHRDRLPRSRGDHAPGGHDPWPDDGGGDVDHGGDRHGRRCRVLRRRADLHRLRAAGPGRAVQARA